MDYCAEQHWCHVTKPSVARQNCAGSKESCAFPAFLRRREALKERLFMQLSAFGLVSSKLASDTFFERDIMTKSSLELRHYIFCDFLNPDVVYPVRTLFDTLVRALALLPLFIHDIKPTLQKISIAHVFVRRFLFMNMAEAQQWLTVSRKQLLREMLHLIDEYKLLCRVLDIAAPIVAPYVGLDLFVSHSGSLSGRLQLTWAGFDAVFCREAFTVIYRELRDPYTVLPRSIGRASKQIEKTPVELRSFDFKTSFPPLWQQLEIFVHESHPELRNKVLYRYIRETGSEDVLFSPRQLFNLLWRCHVVYFKGNATKTSYLALDWIRGGFRRRLHLISELLDNECGGEIIRLRFGLNHVEKAVFRYLTGAFLCIDPEDTSNRKTVEEVFLRPILATKIVTLVPVQYNEAENVGQP